MSRCDNSWLQRIALESEQTGESPAGQPGWISVCPAGRHLAMERAGAVHVLDMDGPQKGWTRW